MGKNNRLINQFKYMHKQVNQLTPEIYASVVLALHREYGWGYLRLNRLFEVSQDIWRECVQSDIDMFAMCYNETGIDVKGKVCDER